MIGAVIMASPLHPVGHVMAIGGVGIMGGRGWSRHRERKQQRDEEATDKSAVNASCVTADDSDSSGSIDSNGKSSGETHGDDATLPIVNADGDTKVEILEDCKGVLPGSTDEQQDDGKEAKTGEAEEEDIFYDPALSINL